MGQRFSFTEAKIRGMATDQSFERGYRYYRSDAVFDVVERGNVVTAKVEGSDYDPYRVQVQFSHTGFESLICTCPYDWGAFANILWQLCYFSSTSRMP